MLLGGNCWAIPWVPASHPQPSSSSTEAWPWSPHPTLTLKPENFQHCSSSIIEEQESWWQEGGQGKGGGRATVPAVCPALVPVT